MSVNVPPSSFRSRRAAACRLERNWDAGLFKHGLERSDLTSAYKDDGPPVPQGQATNGNSCPTGTQFPVPFPYGYGMHTWYNKEDGPSRNMWAIVDKVQLPKVTKDFVLRWRWDTEQVRISLMLPVCAA